MHGPIFNRKDDQVGYVEGDWAIDRSGQKRWLVDGGRQPTSSNRIFFAAHESVCDPLQTSAALANG